ncbi:MAG: type 2 lantipeptide synthetase LanM, partial [Myxococcaceae bacterium]
LDLYSGLPGIALFLAHLDRLTGTPRHQETLQRIIQTMRGMLQPARTKVKAVGAFDGWGGILYALVNLSVLMDEPALLDEATSLLDVLPGLIADDTHLDIVSGAAGCIGGLLTLHHRAPTSRALVAAAACGERLLAQVKFMEQGIGWLTPVSPDRALCGFAHGAAGIAWALLELGAVTGDERFRQAAQQAWVHERSLFSFEAGGWPDLRSAGTGASQGSANGAPRALAAWCHGAAGIGMARVRAMSLHEDVALREEVAAAVTLTLRKGFGQNHSLCHGDLGSLDLLLHADSVLGTEARLSDETTRLARQVLDGIGQGDWRCATPRSIETPGLMLGLAGIGYGLLRIAAPARVPSVLLLEGSKPGA